MFNSINNFGGYDRPVRQNPDDYAKTYAQQNGLSIEDAKAELKAQYGDPVKDASGSVFNFSNQSDISNMDYSEIFDSPVSEQESIGNLINSILNSIMNFLNGNNKNNNLKGAGELEPIKIGDEPQEPKEPSAPQERPTVEGKEKPEKPSAPQTPKEPSAPQTPKEPSAPQERPAVEGKVKPEKPSRPPRPELN